MHTVKYYLFSLTLILSTGLIFGCKPAEKQNLSIDDTLFNTEWAFYKTQKKRSVTDIINHDSWEEVTLPHTMNIEPLVVNAQWQGDGWYKKTLRFDESWVGKNVFLKFEGAMMEADVWLNGTHLKKHYGGYLPFSVNLTEHLQSGDNQLLVRTNNEDNLVTGPKPLEDLDFNMYGGLYRDVKLVVENSAYISDAVEANIVGGGGLFITYPEVAKEKATVNVKTHIQASEGKSNEKLTLVHELLREDVIVSRVESDAFNLKKNDDTHVELAFTVNKPQLWHPDSPNLYQLRTSLIENNTILDDQTTQIGIRQFEVTTDGVFINGEKLWLRGVNRHQEYPYVGYAISPQADYRDAYRIKSAGFDYVRLSHYPHSPAFMKAADEIGLVLLDAILGWQYINNDPKFVAHVQQTCRDLIRRDRNHPSVFAWECSLNESWMENMEPFVERLNEIVHEEFPGENVYSAGWVEYGYDIYLQARQHRLQHYGPPDKPYIVSEYGDWEYYAMNAGLNQDAWGDLLQAERSSRQLREYSEERLLQQATNIQEAHNDNYSTVAEGDGYWVMFDYNRGYANDLESSGIMSIDRLPKFSYYFYQSQRSPDTLSSAYASGPMVHIASYWKSDSSTEVRIFSNAEEVELFLNGTSLGKQKPQASPTSNNLKHPPIIFTIGGFSPGELEAQALINDAVVATHKVATPSKAYRLNMSSDLRLGGVTPTEQDIVFVYAELQSENGLPIPTSGTTVTFEAIKGAEIIGPNTSETKAGIASVLVKLKDLSEAPIVSAKANALPPSRLHLQ